MKIVVGSSNPVKIKAVRSVFEKAFKNINVLSIEVDSGVRDQPWGWKETYKGAKNRAENCFKADKNIDFAVGLEGGMFEYDFGVTTAGLVVVRHKGGKIGVGISGQLLLPNKIVKGVKKGKELGTVLEKMSGKKDIKKKEGAFGFFTKGLVTRTDAYEQAVAFALSKFIFPPKENPGVKFSKPRG